MAVGVAAGAVLTDVDGITISHRVHRALKVNGELRIRFPST